MHPGHFDHYDAENLGSVIFFLRALIFSVSFQQVISLTTNSGTELLLPAYVRHQNLHQFFDLELGLSQSRLNQSRLKSVSCLSGSGIQPYALAKFIHRILSFLSPNSVLSDIFTFRFQQLCLLWTLSSGSSKKKADFLLQF